MIQDAPMMYEDGTWYPPARVLNAAQLLATGDYTLRQAAAEAGMSKRTLERWNLDPRFRALVRRLWADAWDQIEGKVVMTGPVALRVIADVIAGRACVDDRYKAATWLVDRLLHRLDRAAGRPADATEPWVELHQSLRLTGDAAAALIAALDADRDRAGRGYRIEPGQLVAPDGTDDSASDGGADPFRST